MVEPATVDLPFFAISTGFQVAVTVQAQIKRDEIERRPDPCDGCDDMHPADGKFDPRAHGDHIVHVGILGLAVGKGPPGARFVFSAGASGGDI